MGPVRFERHARNRMRAQGITPEDVQAALAAPQTERENHEGKDRREAWAPYRDAWLRVVYVRERGGLTVITVTLTDRGPERRSGRKRDRKRGRP